MELRPELCAPVVSPQRIAELSAAIEHIERLPFGSQAAEAAVVAFNAETGHAYVVEDFHSYWESSSVEDFALEAARPAWPKVPDVTRDELVEIVRRIMEGAIKDQRYYLLLLGTNVAYPRVGELIFQPPPELVDSSPERIVDVALGYRPIAL